MPRAATPLPAELAGPVELMLARAVEIVPLEGALPGGSLFEPKFDGYRLCIVRTNSGARLWTRRGTDLTDVFPDLVAAAVYHLRPRDVVDGEVVAWADDRLSFDLLQQRMARRRDAAALARVHPVSYVAFDLLAARGRDWRASPLRARRAQLERMAATWAPPLQISPVTIDRVEALEWWEAYRPAGVEGLVVKAGDGIYRPGRRDWLKVKNRQTRDVIVGAVTGSLRRPAAIIAGLMRDGELSIAGRTTELTAAQAGELAAALTAAAADHPWPQRISAGVFGSRRVVDITRVDPRIVVEVDADTATQAGRFRHVLRYRRIRWDMQPGDVDPM